VPLIFVGNWAANDYGRRLKSRWDGTAGLTLHDAVYDQATLARLRVSAVGYVHGHSIGGTNPSLVEALFDTDRVLAFDCAFNRATLANESEYFDSASALAAALVRPGSGIIPVAALKSLRTRYLWRSIADDYLRVTTQALSQPDTTPVI